MKYRDFKGHAISDVGLGTWQLGSADWGAVNEEEAFGILKAFTDAGGNFIDTADVYGMGVSEQVIGKFLKTVDEPVYVATKLGRRHDGSFGWPQNFTYDGLRTHVESSLKHLNLDSLFLEQLHCIPTEELRTGKVFDHLEKLKDEKLIQHWGVSVETTEEALLCLKHDGLSSLQIIFNLFRQHVADEVIEKAKEKNVAIIARVPLASGLLTGKFDDQTQFTANDHRNFNANGEAFNAGETFSGIAFNNGIKIAKEMKGMLPEGVMAQWAIRWILDHEGVTTVIPGASKISQVQSNVAASALDVLPNETHKKLRDYYNTNVKEQIRGHY